MSIRDLVPRFRKDRTPAPRNDNSGLTGLQNDMNRLFDEFFGAMDLPGRWWPGPLFDRQDRSLGDFVPRVNVVENDKTVTVSAELPGMDEKDVKVELDEDVLVIKGEKKHESNTRDGDWHRMEYSYGSFHREIPLPASINPAKTKARFSKGVLRIDLPKVKSDTASRKTVEVVAE